MAKLAQEGERAFSPIAQKLIDAVSGPPPQSQREEESPEKREEEPRVVQMPARTGKAPKPEKRDEERPEAEASPEQHLTRAMRYLVTPEEKDETERFIQRLSQATQIPLTHSNIMRACRDLLFQVEDRLITELGRAKLRRPINDKRAIAFFESRLTDIIRAAIRQSPLPYQRG
jgi:plasmid stabilization system protein ParE